MSRVLPHATAPVSGRVVVPGSKSETNRALVLAALADGPSTLSGALASRDSDLMVAALEALGAGVTVEGPGELRITPPQRFSSSAASIDCGLAGTVMRFVPPLAALADGTTRFHGDPHASARPMAGILEGLRQLGADIDDDRLPFSVTGPLTGRAVTVDATETSQYVSGLLLIGALLPQGLDLTHAGERLPSRPHIEMTASMLRRRGVVVTETGEASWRVEPGTVAALDAQIEPDLTNAAVFLAAAAATGGAVTVPGWPADSLQPGALFLDVVARMGAEVVRGEEEVTVRSSGVLRAIDVDLQTASELTCVVAALAALAEGTSLIRGVAHIRGHETDRLAALVTELTRLGIESSETDDGLVITGGGGRASAPFGTYADHRMVHTAAILGLRIPGIEVTDFECVGKTMPDFGERWNTLVGS